MTNEEFVEKYHDVELTFSGYWKYTFSFVGTAPDGVVIRANYGGNSDDIYRYEVSNNEVNKVGDIRWVWNSVTATKDGELMFSYYD